MLTTDDLDRGRTLAAELELYNAERRQIEDTMVREAAAMVDADGAGARHALLVAGDGWHPGVVGIVAARLAERFHRPSIVIALEWDVGRGSGRSVAGIPLHQAVQECDDLLEAFGGHRAAIGLTVRRERIAELRARFEAAVQRHSRPDDRHPTLEVDAEVSLSAMTPALGTALAALEPHGAGNPEPVLLARGVDVEGVRTVGDPARLHLKLRLKQDGRTVPAIGFGLGNLPVNVGDRVDVAFTPRLSRWQGVERLEMALLDVRESASQDCMEPVDNAGISAIP